MERHLKNTVLKTISLAFLATALTACQAGQRSFNENIQASVDANANSTTHLDWESSEYHPSSLFTKLRQDYFNLAGDVAAEEKMRKQTCETLSTLSNDTLMIFENEILNPANREVLSNCASSLKNRLDREAQRNRQDIQYYVNATSKSPSNIDFKLDMEVITDSNYMSFNKHDASVKEKEVILTFDDGPHDMFTSSILRTLKEAGNIKAMFFELGRQIKANPARTKEVFDAGHVVANHSWNHNCMDNTTVCKNNNKGKILSNNEVFDEVAATFNIIKQITGKMAPFFRFPYGDNREIMSKYFKEQGILEMHWNIDSNDWRYKQKFGTEQINFTSKEVLYSALRSLDKYNKGVVLFHDIHRRTAEILPQFLYELHKRNFKVVVLMPQNIEEPSLKATSFQKLIKEDSAGKLQ